MNIDTLFNRYSMYLALKLHFTSDKYDIIAMGANVRISREQFEKKGIRFAIMKLAKKYGEEEFIQYVLANLLAGDKNGGVFAAEGEERLRAWQKRLQSLSYLYKQDLIKLNEQNLGTGLSPIWTSINGQHPLILREYLAGHIMLETLVVLDRIYKYKGQLDEVLSFDPVWKQTSKMLRKYDPFIKADVSSFSVITEEVFT